MRCVKPGPHECFDRYQCLINFFAGHSTHGSAGIEQCIEHDLDMVTCGPVVMELIQGCKSEREVTKVRVMTSNILYVNTEEMLYERSAMLYRQNKRPDDQKIYRLLNCNDRYG